MRLQYDWSSNGIFNAAHVGLRSDSNGAAPEFDLGGSNSLGRNSCAANVANGSSTALTTPNFYFRSSPERELKSDIGPCRFPISTAHRSMRA